MTTTPVEEIPLWVAVPPGYFPLPLHDVDAAMERAEAVLTDVGGPSPLVSAVTGALSVLLSELGAAGSLYCGIGHHTSPADGSVVTSSLVVSLQEFEGTRNPRLVLADLVQARADAGQRGQVDLLDLADRPMLFVERTRQLPTPGFPGQPPVAEDATSPVFQLEAYVPADDGSKLAAIELSTPFEAHGPEFRGMIVQMAATVSFEPPPAGAGESGRIGQVLG
ncbi:hypothetical protein [Amycolatopsis sp. NBC_01480]|uniref:hypothetical protein n=1 Tax=Amycolatopsis sp. NBC_01480 TaxID=2903562 RepID=UPI002E2AA3EA|nr:hypothetical protein [Amycolatopsis sp. NBC_01480]